MKGTTRGGLLHKCSSIYISVGESADWNSRPTEVLQSVRIAELETLLSEIATKDEAAIQELERLGLTVPETSRDFCTKIRATLEAPLRANPQSEIRNPQ